VLREIDALDLFEVYRRARCPLLIVSGADHGWVAHLLPVHLVPAWEAYAAWTRAQLDVVAREVPYVSVAALPTGHDVHREDPSGLLWLLLNHLGTARGSGTSKRA